MDPLKNLILVPTDFSEVCENALNQAADAARFFNYKIALLHVLDKQSDRNEVVISRLNDLSESIAKSHGVVVDTFTREGDIFSTIPEVAKDLGAKLIFLGTHGKVGMQKLTGSYAMKIVTSSPVPVIVTQERAFKDGYKKIILPITSDAGPVEKTNWAIYMARAFKSEVHIFHLNKAEIEATVRMLTLNLSNHNIKYVVNVSEGGDFTKNVIDYSAANNADLIMIMTNPDKNFKTFLLGSYDEELMFNIPKIPVMCINPRQYNWEKIFDY